MGSLENGAACLIISMDAVHLEIDDQMADMTGSMLMMDLIFKLKIRFPTMGTKIMSGSRS